MIKTANRRPAVDLAELTLQRLATCLGVRRSHDKGHSRARAAVNEFIESVLNFLEANERFFRTTAENIHAFQRETPQHVVTG